MQKAYNRVTGHDLRSTVKGHTFAEELIEIDI